MDTRNDDKLKITIRWNATSCTLHKGQSNISCNRNDACRMRRDYWPELETMQLRVLYVCSHTTMVPAKESKRNYVYYTARVTIIYSSRYDVMQPRHWSFISCKTNAGIFTHDRKAKETTSIWLQCHPTEAISNQDVIKLSKRTWSSVNCQKMGNQTENYFDTSAMTLKN